MALDPGLWQLLRAVADRGDAAWPTLCAALEPELVAMARRQPVGRLRDREDTPREIVTRALSRLHAREFTAVKKLCAIDPAPELQAWLRVIVRRSAIDYMRESPEFDRGNATREPRWISLASLSSSEASPAPDSLAEKRDLVIAFVRDATTRAQTERRDHGEAGAIAALALEWRIARIHVRRLVTRGDQYVAVLAAVLAGHSYPETAEALGLSRREIELTVRYLEELLAARGFGRP